MKYHPSLINNGRSSIQIISSWRLLTYLVCKNVTCLHTDNENNNGLSLLSGWRLAFKLVHYRLEESMKYVRANQFILIDDLWQPKKLQVLSNSHQLARLSKTHPRWAIMPIILFSRFRSISSFFFLSEGGLASDTSILEPHRSA